MFGKMSMGEKLNAEKRYIIRMAISLILIPITWSLDEAITGLDMFAIAQIVILQ